MCIYTYREEDNMTMQEDNVGEEPQEGCVLPRVIFIRAKMTGLLHPLLPFAVLKENPIEAVQHYIEQYRVDTSNSDAMRNAWNKVFHAISSDSIYFVCAWDSVLKASPRMLKASGMTFIIGSCGPHHRRWLTTRPVVRNGKQVMWCIEIDMHASPFERVVTLSEANMIHLVPGLLDQKAA